MHWQPRSGDDGTRLKLSSVRFAAWLSIRSLLRSTGLGLGFPGSPLGTTR